MTTPRTTPELKTNFPRMIPCLSRAQRGHRGIEARTRRDRWSFRPPSTGVHKSLLVTYPIESILRAAHPLVEPSLLLCRMVLMWP
jgi:hypothetical protein